MDIHMIKDQIRTEYGVSIAGLVKTPTGYVGSFIHPHTNSNVYFTTDNYNSVKCYGKCLTTRKDWRFWYPGAPCPSTYYLNLTFGMYIYRNDDQYYLTPDCRNDDMSEELQHTSTIVPKVYPYQMTISYVDNEHYIRDWARPDVMPIWVFHFKGFRMGYNEVDKTISFYVHDIYKGTIKLTESDISVFNRYVNECKGLILADI